MPKKSKTLEPQIILYLKNRGKTNFQELVNHFHKGTGILIEKIEFRINKMSAQKKIEIRDGVVGLKVGALKQPSGEYDEMVELGFTRIERKGNINRLQSKLQGKDLRQAKQSLAANLPQMKQEIQDTLGKIEKLVLEKPDPLDTLSVVSGMNLVVNPDTYTESSFKGNQLCVEIMQNIILKNEIAKYGKNDEQNIETVIKLTEYVAKKLPSYYLSKAIARTDLSIPESEIWLDIISTFLILRGDAYPQHYEEISLGLFSRIDFLLKQKGFTIEEYWVTLKEIVRQIEHRFNEPKKELLDFQNRVFEYGEQEVSKGSITDVNEIIPRFRKEFPSDVAKAQTAYKKLYELRKKDSFEIEINKKISKKILELFSMKLGDNKSWQNPLDKSDIAIKPIINFSEKYYCFLTVHLIRNVIQIIESVLNEQEKEQIEYHKVKGDYFEQKTMSLLTRIMGGKSYSQLKYQKDKELDGLIVMNDIVFLVEIKGKKKRIIAGVEDILELTKKDFVSSIGKAYHQVNRALNYIQSAEEVEFKDKTGHIAVKLRKSNIRKIYLINVCVENYSKLALDINLVKKWDPTLIVGDNYPWIVTIYDLIVISELLENQSAIFVDYLENRLQVSLTNELKTSDELDFLGYFLKYGNLKKNAEMKKAKGAITLIHGFSESIDKYYSFKRGEIDFAEKPVLEVRKTK